MKYRNNIVRFTIASMTAGVVIGTTPVLFAGENPYTPLGIHSGSFFIYPVLEAGLGYDDNVFRLPDAVIGSSTPVRTKQSDVFTRFDASVNAASDWNRHALNGLASVVLRRYDEHTSEDYERYALETDGRLDVKRGSFFTGEAGYNRGKEDRSSVNSREGTVDQPIVYGTNPTFYDRGYVGAGYDYQPAKLRALVEVDYETLKYDDVTNAFTGENVDNSDRARTRPSGLLRLGYEVMPKRRLYLQGEVYNVDYDKPVDNNGVARNASGYKATAGMSVDLSNLLMGDVYLGYLEHNYDSSELEDISSNLIGFGLDWFPTRLTRLGLNLDRRVEESTEATASGYLSTIFALDVDHELKRNIILFGDAALRKNDFTQNAPGQKEEEEITEFGLGAKYLISRRWYTSAEYLYRERTSDLASQEFTNNIGLITFGANW